MTKRVTNQAARLALCALLSACAVESSPIQPTDGGHEADAGARAQREPLPGLFAGSGAVTGIERPDVERLPPRDAGADSGPQGGSGGAQAPDGGADAAEPDASSSTDAGPDAGDSGAQLDAGSDSAVIGCPSGCTGGCSGATPIPCCNTTVGECGCSAFVFGECVL